MVCRGLLNAGATCYANAATQLLAHCDAFVAYVGRPPPGCDKAAAVGELMAWMRTPNGGDGLKVPAALLRIAAPFMDVGRQNDAHEFLGHVIDELEEEAKANGRAELFATLFRGVERVTTSCSGCAAVETGKEEFTTIALPLPTSIPGRDEGVTLEALLGGHMAPDEVTGRACEPCKAKCGATRTHVFARLPRILVLSVKRFAWDGSTSRRPVILPLRLPVSATKEYRLACVVCHRGGQTGGHYAAFCPEGPEGPGGVGWTVHDDDVTIETAGPPDPSAVYMAAYEMRKM